MQYVWAQSTHITLTAVKALSAALKHYTALNFNSVKAYFISLCLSFCVKETC